MPVKPNTIRCRDHEDRDRYSDPGPLVNELFCNQYLNCNMNAIKIQNISLAFAE